MSGTATNLALNTLLNRMFKASPDYVIPSQFQVGQGNTTPSATDTVIEVRSPIGTADATLDTCDATTDWTESSAGIATTLNTTSFKEGTGSLNLGKTNAAATAIYTKTIASKNISGKYLYLWFYIKDATELAKLATTNAITITVSSDGFTTSDTWYFQKAKLIAGGWTHIGFNVASPDATVGNTDETAITGVKITITTTNAADLLTIGDVRMDAWQSFTESSDLKANFVSGYPTFDETNKKVTVRCYISSLESIGEYLREIGIFNTDTVNKLMARIVHTAISKSITDEISYVIVFKAVAA